MAMENLHNTGMRAIGDDAALESAEKTIVVVGPARGGTSMVAGALHHLGVFTGDQSTAPVFEDVRLADAFENHTATEVERIARDYDARHPVWAYKRPGIIDNFGKIHDIVRNPVYLFIFKDIFSMANRNSISMQMDTVNGLTLALRGYEKIIGFIQRRQPSGILLSYDRVMQDKEALVDALTRLVAPLTVSDEQRTNTLAFIDPNPSEYLNSSRVTRAAGSVTEVSATRIAGTAMYAAKPTKPIEVEVLVNGAKTGLAHTGEEAPGGGFHFAYEFPSPLGVGDIVALQLSEDVAPFVEGIRIAS